MQMNKKPKVSIIIPVYNGEQYIRESIDSALAQTYENCEIIVVNDGSTDATENIVKEYGEKLSYYKKENGGVSTALNMGIRHMTGQYIQYLPADDMLHPEKIEKQIEAILKSGNEMTISWTGWNLNYSDKKVKKEVPMPYVYNDKQLYTKDVFPVILGMINTVTVLFNKKYIEKVGVFDESLTTSQDYDMWFRIYKNQTTIYIDEPLVDYRVHEQQGTQADPQFIKNCVDLAKKMIFSLDKEQIIDIFENEYRYLCYMMEHYLTLDWMECYEEMKQRLCALEEPAEVEMQCKKLEVFLKKEGQCSDIILYCAGKNGKRLLRNLNARGIKVSKFSDGDKTKYGTMIDGVECVAPDSLDKEKSHVIVTKDYPADVVEVLREQGFQHVDTYENIGSRVQYSMPIKKKMLEMKQFMEDIK